MHLIGIPDRHSMLIRDVQLVQVAVMAVHSYKGVTVVVPGLVQSSPFLDISCLG